MILQHIRIIVGDAGFEPRSLVRYQWATASPSATTSLMSHHMIFDNCWPILFTALFLHAHYYIRVPVAVYFCFFLSVVTFLICQKHRWPRKWRKFSWPGPPTACVRSSSPPSCIAFYYICKKRHLLLSARCGSSPDLAYSPGQRQNLNRRWQIFPKCYS